jgi:hypothetical protein
MSGVPAHRIPAREKAGERSLTFVNHPAPALGWRRIFTLIRENYHDPDDTKGATTAT